VVVLVSKINPEILKKLRKDNKLTQEAVAKLIGVGRTSYTKIEIGKQDVDSALLIRLSKVFNVPSDYLLGIEQQDKQFDLQMFGKKNASDANVAMAFGKILTLKDEEAKKLTLQIMDEVLHLSIPKLEALHSLIKTMK
jgi:transcriptional regulator with XRE-family HTH domain